MKKDEKPSVGVLIALKAKDKMKGEKKEKDYDKMYAEMAAEILEAVEDKDAKKLGMLLKDFVKTCAHNPCGMKH